MWRERDKRSILKEIAGLSYLNKNGWKDFIFCRLCGEIKSIQGCEIYWLNCRGSMVTDKNKNIKRGLCIILMPVAFYNCLIYMSHITFSPLFLIYDIHLYIIRGSLLHHKFSFPIPFKEKKIVRGFLKGFLISGLTHNMPTLHISNCELCKTQFVKINNVFYLNKKVATGLIKKN